MTNNFTNLVKELTNIVVKQQYTDTFLQKTIDSRLDVEYTFNTNLEIMENVSNDTKPGRLRSTKRENGLSKPTVQKSEVSGRNREKQSYGRKSIQEKFEKRISIDSNLADIYKRTGNYSLPFIDTTLYSHISKTNPESLPGLPKIISHGTIQDSDIASIERYRISSRTMHKTAICSIVAASVNAAKALGIFDDELITDTLSEKETMKRVTSNNSSSGWPLFRRKDSSSASADTKLWLRGILNKPSVYSLFKNPLMLNPQYIAHRFQPKVNEISDSIEISIRQVWVVPQRIIALEHYFFGNIFDRYKHLNIQSNEPLTNSGLNLFEVSRRIISKLRGYVGNTPGKCLYSMDYSKFDSTIPSIATDIFFNLLKSKIKMSNSDSKLYDLLRYYNKRSPVVHNNRKYILNRGMSSGSLLTHIFDTWWNLTLWYLSYDIIQNNNIESCERILKNAKYKGIFNDSYYANFVPKEYTKRNDIALCGDDTLIFTSLLEIHIHSELCRFFGMSCSIDHICCSTKSDTFFVGKYWNNKSEPIQTEKYMSTHIIVRQRWYKVEELGYNIKQYLDPIRILSICGQFANGYEYVRKTFFTYDKLIKFLNEKRGYMPLRDGPDVKYIGRDKLFMWQYY